MLRGVRLALILGLLDPQSVVAWADDQIVERDRVEPVVLSIAMAEGRSARELVDVIRTDVWLPEIDGSDVRWALGLARRIFRSTGGRGFWVMELVISLRSIVHECEILEMMTSSYWAYHYSLEQPPVTPPWDEGAWADWRELVHEWLDAFAIEEAAIPSPFRAPAALIADDRLRYTG